MAADPDFRGSLLRHGLLIDTSVPGLYGRGARFEAIITRLEALISDLEPRQPHAGGIATPEYTPEYMRFPPVMPRATVERSGYAQAFPHLLGTVHCFNGDDAAHLALVAQVAHGDPAWLAGQSTTDIVLTPAACYPVYGAVAARGPLPAHGHIAAVQSWCFRHEPSPDPARMQAFRQREFVYMGNDAGAAAFRETWQARAQAFAARLGLPHRLSPATDPFFGWHGEIMADLQREGALKTELLIPVADDDAWTACISFNLHNDHFSRPSQLRLPDGALAHTACVGFGLERLALALLRHRGLDLSPECVG